MRALRPATGGMDRTAPKRYIGAMSFDFSIESDAPGNPAEVRARRERTALQTLRSVDFEEAKRILDSVAPPGDSWGEAFHKALDSARDGLLLTGDIDRDIGFLIAAKPAKGIWFWRTGAGAAKGLIPEDRVTAFLELARKKGLA